MGKGRGKLTQDFTISLDIDKFCDALKDKLVEAVEASDKHLSNVRIDDYETDGCFVNFYGSYKTGADTWYYKQTMEEPEESGFEPDAYLSKGEIEKEFERLLYKCVDVKHVNDTTVNIQNPIAKLITVYEVDDDNEPEFDDDYDDGPDPDAAYEAWKDRWIDEH